MVSTKDARKKNQTHKHANKRTEDILMQEQKGKVVALLRCSERREKSRRVGRTKPS